jgi:prepilin-type N-terminal cleavage/methylation domain-containing protein/prepilin-type processing-associated H-X9-DG protein
MHSQARRQGFTLIELLTVIAIIGILAAITIPAIQATTATARASACVSNLRQVGVAAMLYANENKNYLPDAGVGQDAAWARTLAAYLSLPATQKNTIFVCPGTAIPVDPAANATDIVLTYGMHAGLMPRNQKAVSLSIVKRPSDVILCADMCQDPNNKGWTPNSIEQPSIIPSQSGGRGAIDLYEFISTATDDDTGNNRWMRYRHKNKVNVVMCDGRVTSFAKGTIQNRHVIFGQ